MEREATCKQLKAIQSLDQNIHKGFLGGLKESTFYIQDEKITVSIEQIGVRTITLTADEECRCKDLYASFTRLERLLNLFDGIFMHLDHLEFSESEMCSETELSRFAYQLKIRRPRYFSSADICLHDTILSFDEQINAEVYSKWKNLVSELGPAHQMYMYAVSNCGFTVDVRCAFLAELAEAIVELVNEKCPSQKLQKGTLAICLKSLINNFGKDIFDKEYSSNFDEIIKAIKNNRVNIMHIKIRRNEPSLSGEECSLYAYKLSLLYRKVLFYLLAIPEEVYSNQIMKYTKIMDDWNGILDSFINRLKRGNIDGANI